MCTPKRKRGHSIYKGYASDGNFPYKGLDKSKFYPYTSSTIFFAGFLDVYDAICSVMFSQTYEIFTDLLDLYLHWVTNY